MKRIMHLATVLSAGMLASPALAGPIVGPTATVQSSASSGGVFDYTITLTDSAASPVPIGTFWYAWVPGKDFLDVAPLTVTSPTGWADLVTHDGPSDGYAIQWVANPLDVIAAGHTLAFEFTSTETPSQVAGSSPFYPTTPEGTSSVYSGKPFSDQGTEFVVTSAVPEPSTIVFALVGGVALLAREKIGRRIRG